MIVCSKCGFQNEDSDAFCGSCASFLEWEGQRVQAAQPEPEPEPEPQPEDAHVGIIDRVKEAIGLGDDPTRAGAGGATAEAETPATAEVEAPAEEAAPAPGPVSAPLPPSAVSAPVLAGGSPPAGSAPAPTNGANGTAAHEPASAAPPSTLPHPGGGTPTPAGASSGPAPSAPAPAPSAPAPAPATTSGAAPAPPGPATSSPAPSPAPGSTPPASAPVGTAAASAAGSVVTGSTALRPGPAAPTAAPTASPAPSGPSSTQTPAGASTQPVSAVRPASAPPKMAAPAAASTGTKPAEDLGAVAPGPVQPEAVKPQAVKTRPVAKKAPSERVINPGDKICGQCGEGNDPVRKFCRRCGGSLVEAVVFKLPWYKALWRRLRQRKYKEAGHRPKMRRRAFGGHGGWVTSWAARIVILAVIVFVVLSFVGPWHKTLKSHESRYWHDVVGFVHPTFNPYFAHDAVASSEAPGHPAMNLIDGEHNTSWQSNGKTTGQSVVVHFTGTANIAKVGFDIGNQDTPQSFQTEPRPAVVKLEFSGAHPVTRTLPLRDITGFQTFTVDTKASTGVTIVIEQVYPATGNGQNVSIAQLEFFTKS